MSVCWQNPVMMVLFCLALSSCGGTTAGPRLKSFHVELSASNDDGEPLGGVAFSAGERALGESDANGQLGVDVSAVEGQSIPITAACPDGYVDPERPAMLKLTQVRRVSDNDAAALSVEVVCTKKLRDVVLVVRAANAPFLTVEVGGKPIGKTDASGYAHFLLQPGREARSLSASLATVDAPFLRPQNPTRIYDLDGRDAILLFEQSFTSERRTTKKRVASTRVVAPKHVPYRIESGRSHGR